MVELDIGLHCSLHGCNQLDFLPFECDGCSKIYCLNHRGKTAHKCADVNFMKKFQPSGATHSHKCSLIVCDKSELLPLICSRCAKHFCVVHRLPEDHQCIVSDQETPVNTVKSPIIFRNEVKLSTKPQMKRLNPKQQSMRAKVALMKLKQKAKGDDNIPTEQRVFFSIKTPNPEEDLLMFVSEKWTFGQLLDKAATIGCLCNRNNETYGTKLVLKNIDDLSNDLDLRVVIKSAIQGKVVFSGSALQLSYSNTDIRL